MVQPHATGHHFTSRSTIGPRAPGRPQHTDDIGSGEPLPRTRMDQGPMSRFDIYSVRYPLLPLKNVVIFPRNVVTLLVGRPRSIQAVEEAMSRDRRIVVGAH